MNQQERFEAFYADQHGVPVDSMAQHRMGDTYDHPHISSHYRTFKGAEAGLLKDAERYRFIRDADRSDGLLDVHDLGLYAMESLDEVVDEAMSKEPSSG
ncbi:hypothetical protein D3C78_1021210 [compost metagenome]